MIIKKSEKNPKKYTIKISKKEWIAIGKEGGWFRTSDYDAWREWKDKENEEEDLREMFEDIEDIEDIEDVEKDNKYPKSFDKLERLDNYLISSNSVPEEGLLFVCKEPRAPSILTISNGVDICLAYTFDKPDNILNNIINTLSRAGWKGLGMYGIESVSAKEVIDKIKNMGVLMLLNCPVANINHLTFDDIRID